MLILTAIVRFVVSVLASVNRPLPSSASAPDSCARRPEAAQQ